MDQHLFRKNAFGQYLCIHLPRWSVARRLRRWREHWGKPVVVAADVRGRAIVVDASEHALREGIRVGWPLADARAMCPRVVKLDHDARGDARALEALGRYMTRFTPVVATGWPAEGGEEIVTPPLLLLDVTGCERLFGSAREIGRRVKRAMRRFGLPASIAVAPTPLAAWGLAWAGTERVVSGERLREAVAGLPVEALRAEERMTEKLRGVGVETVGAVLGLPREALPSRFGRRLVVRIEELLGERVDPIVGLAFEEPVEAREEFESATDSLEVLWAVLRELVDRVAAELAKRGRGARRIEAWCWADRSFGREPVVRRVPLSRGERDPKRLFELLRCATEEMECGEGFAKVEVRVPLHERVRQEQIGFSEEKEREDEIEVGRLVERLGVRLGDGAISVPELVESHVPERAWRCGVATEARAKGQEEIAGRVALLPERPMCLLPEPVEVRVMAEPSDDLSGAPVQMTHAREVHRLVDVWGPERIAGEWWLGEHGTRDYYDVMDEGGRRYWVFRQAEAADEERVRARWFLHGIFR